MARKILIIRFSSIGDIVLTTPVIRCLKQSGEQDAEVEIHYLTKEKFAPVLYANPNISKIHTIDDSLETVMPQLIKESFDYIIDLHNNIRSGIVKNKLCKPSSSVKKLNFKKWLYVNFKFNILPDIHIVDRYMDAAKHLEINNDGKGLDYFIPPEDEVEISSLPDPHQEGYIGFAIGAKHATKKLPVEKIISLCKKIDTPIVLLGDEEDSKNAILIKKAVGKSIYDACGKYNINQSASIIRQSEKIITHDTGLMHIASAFNKKIISIWGNTVPAFGMYPYLSSDVDDRSIIIEEKNLPCRPCSKLGYKRCPKGHFKCMNLIDEEQIVSLINSE